MKWISCAEHIVSSMDVCIYCSIILNKNSKQKWGGEKGKERNERPFILLIELLELLITCKANRLGFISLSLNLFICEDENVFVYGIQ